MNRQWQCDTARLKAITDNRIVCKCTHSITPNIKVEERNFCGNCGREVFTKKQFRIKVWEKLERKCI